MFFWLILYNYTYFFLFQGTKVFPNLTHLPMTIYLGKIQSTETWNQRVRRRRCSANYGKQIFKDLMWIVNCTGTQSFINIKYLILICSKTYIEFWFVVSKLEGVVCLSSLHWGLHIKGIVSFAKFCKVVSKITVK